MCCFWKCPLQPSGFSPSICQHSSKVFPVGFDASILVLLNPSLVVALNVSVHEIFPLVHTFVSDSNCVDLKALYLSLALLNSNGFNKSDSIFLSILLMIFSTINLSFDMTLVVEFVLLRYARLLRRIFSSVLGCSFNVDPSIGIHIRINSIAVNSPVLVVRITDWGISLLQPSASCFL